MADVTAYDGDLFISPVETVSLALACGEFRVALFPDGRVETSGPMPEATEVFWASVREAFPEFVDACIRERTKAEGA